MKKLSIYPKVFIAALVVILSGFIIFSSSYLEIGKPVIAFDQNIKAIGRQKNIDIHFSDSNSGLFRLNVELVQDSKGRIIADKTISAKGVKNETLSLAFNAAELKLHDGTAVIKITAIDHSLFKNKAVISRDVNIDTVPPQIYLLKNINYVNQGGTGYVAYYASKTITDTGVFVNDYFTPGHPAIIDNKPHYVVYFAMPMDAGKNTTRIMALARDEAGNETKISLPFVIKEKKFRSDKMNLSDNFLQTKMPEFQSMVPSLMDKTPLDVFIYVNSQMRHENFATIQKICEKSAPKELWEGVFLRMSNAAPMALFGDKRYYVYNKQTVAESVHEGVDLASVSRAPVEASNHGIVVFIGTLGIYGNTVIIDHGLGLFSLYAHLSTIDTSVGKKVVKGGRIGLSGLSGLAGGDHLHFSIIIGGRFVNPQEWWDPHWIANNITNR